MNNNIFITEESDLDIGIDLTNYSESEETEKLQRTKEWDEDRRGSWNASEVKALMSCNKSYSKKSWLTADKYLAFSDGALKYIFKKAKERETGRTVKTSQTSAMKYGTIIEDLTFRRANEYLKPLGLYLKKVGYKRFDDIPTAGASSDAIVCRIDDDSIVASAEMKACVSWETLYERTFEATDEKSIDFWQTQQQMLAWNVKETYYFVIAPPSGIMKYLNAEDVTALYDEWLNETEMEVEIIKQSEIHVNNLKKRMIIAEDVISEYLTNKGSIKEILYNRIDEEKGVIKSQTSVILSKEEMDLIEIAAEVPEGFIFGKKNVSRETLTTEEIVNSISDDDSLEMSSEKIKEVIDNEPSEFEKAIAEEAKKQNEPTSIEEMDEDLPF